MGASKRAEMQFSARQTRGYGRKTVETRRLAAAEKPPSKGCRGATLCKFTTYSAGRYDGIPRTCSRLRGKAGESKRADRRRRRLYFYSRRVAGAETSKLGVFERQRVLHEIFCKSPRVAEIERHWVGLKHSLLHYMQQKCNLASVPFDVAHMLRLQDEQLQDEPAREYQVVLRPLEIPTTSAC